MRGISCSRADSRLRASAKSERDRAIKVRTASQLTASVAAAIEKNEHSDLPRMEVAGAGQWRREWAGTAEYGKVKLMEYVN